MSLYKISSIAYILHVIFMSFCMKKNHQGLSLIPSNKGKCVNKKGQRICRVIAVVHVNWQLDRIQIHGTVAFVGTPFRYLLSLSMFWWGIVVSRFIGNTCTERECHYYLGLGPEQYKKEKLRWVQAFIAICFLIVDKMWPAASLLLLLCLPCYDGPCL